jgi:hypothetical protein
MEDYTKQLLHINNISANRDLVKYFSLLDVVSNSLAKLSNSLYEDKVKLEDHYSELESKIFRYIMTNHSIIKLLKGLNFNLMDKNISIVDIFSVKSLMRYQIESYLVMFYLFFDNVSTTELNFRYDIYKLHALNKQITFAKKGESAKRKAKDVEKEIGLLKEKIISSEKYLRSNGKIRKSLLSPNKAILKDRKKLFEDSGLNRSRISDMWSVYSNYAHSEHISDRQFNSYYKFKTASFNEDSVLTVEICLILNSRLINMLIKQFDSCKNKFKSLNPREKAIIDLWGKLHD